jgi:hypothetical protein
VSECFLYLGFILFYVSCFLFVFTIFSLVFYLCYLFFGLFLLSFFSFNICFSTHMSFISSRLHNLLKRLVVVVVDVAARDQGFCVCLRVAPANATGTTAGKS